MLLFLQCTADASTSAAACRPAAATAANKPSAVPKQAAHALRYSQGSVSAEVQFLQGGHAAPAQQGQLTTWATGTPNTQQASAAGVAATITAAAAWHASRMVQTPQPLMGLQLQPLGQQAAAASHADRVVLAAQQFAGVAAGAVSAVGFGTDVQPAVQAAERLQLAGELAAAAVQQLVVDGGSASGLVPGAGFNLCGALTGAGIAAAGAPGTTATPAAREAGSQLLPVAGADGTQPPQLQHSTAAGGGQAGLGAVPHSESMLQGTAAALSATQPAGSALAGMLQQRSGNFVFGLSSASQVKCLGAESLS